MKGNPIVAAGRAVALGAFLAACVGDDAGRTDAGEAGMASGEGTAATVTGDWALAAFGTPESGEAPLADTEITMSLTAEGRVAGTDGCNRYMGGCTLADDSLSFGPLASTMKACPEPVMDQSERYLRGLEGTARALVRSDRLELRGAEGETPVLTFVRAGVAED